MLDLFLLAADIILAGMAVFGAYSIFSALLFELDGKIGKTVAVRLMKTEDLDRILPLLDANTPLLLDMEQLEVLENLNLRHLVPKECALYIKSSTCGGEKKTNI